MRLPSRAAATATLAALPPRNLPNDLDVLESDADLQWVDVDAAAPDGEDVECLVDWCGQVGLPNASRDWWRVAPCLMTVPPVTALMSIVCPDILTFGHASVVTAATASSSGSPRSERDVTRWRSSSTGRALCRCTISSRRRSRAAIRDGELAPGDRFENELALAKRLNLSRPTTRRAIQELVDKGLLVRKRGVGTQVVQNPVHRPRRADQPVRRPRPGRPGADHRAARLPRRSAPTKRSPAELNLQRRTPRS